LIPVKVDGLPDTRSDNAATVLQLRASDVVQNELPAKLAFSTLYAKDHNEAQLKLQALKVAIELVDTAADLWKSVNSLPELFHTTKDILTSISQSEIHSSFPSQIQVFQTSMFD
jgi:hypothetical protein